MQMKLRYGDESSCHVSSHRTSADVTSMAVEPSAPTSRWVPVLLFANLATSRQFRAAKLPESEEPSGDGTPVREAHTATTSGLVAVRACLGACRGLCRFAESM